MKTYDGAMREIQKVCVYCGSSSGIDPVYREAAERLGQYLAKQKISLIYGAGKLGLMGALADEVLTGGGEVIGVIPHHLIALEVGHTKLTSLITVDSMHARKHQMAELADAFIALPGGIGTAEELLEVLTWLQLNLHAKPIGFGRQTTGTSATVSWIGGNVPSVNTEANCPIKMAWGWYRAISSSNGVGGPIQRRRCDQGHRTFS